LYFNKPIHFFLNKTVGLAAISLPTLWAVLLFATRALLQDRDQTGPGQAPRACLPVQYTFLLIFLCLRAADSAQ
jgi:hypothetical protein